jgi:hypothetical protein
MLDAASCFEEKVISRKDHHLKARKKGRKPYDMHTVIFERHGRVLVLGRKKELEGSGPLCSRRQ